MAVRMLHQLSALQFSKEHGRGASHIAAEVIEKSIQLLVHDPDPAWL